MLNYQRVLHAQNMLNIYWNHVASHCLVPSDLHAWWTQLQRGPCHGRHGRLWGDVMGKTWGKPTKNMGKPTINMGKPTKNVGTPTKNMGKTHQKHGNDFTSENEWKWHFLENPCDFCGCQRGYLQGKKLRHEIYGKYVIPLRDMLQNTSGMEYHGISWNIMEYHGISWNILPMIFPFKPSFLHLLRGFPTDDTRKFCSWRFHQRFLPRGNPSGCRAFIIWMHP